MNPQQTMNRYFYGSEKLHLLKTLHSASRDDDTETIERLLDQATNDIDIDGTIASQRNEPTALQIACMWGNLSTVRLLLDRGANIEARDKCLQAPLHHASMKNSLEVAQLLLDRGANVEAKDHNLQTPLHFISSRNNVEFAQLLLDRGANIEAKDEELQTPLYHAMNAEYQRGRTQRMDVAVLLLARGADSNANGKHGWRLLHAVCASNNCLAAQMLIDHDATGINAKDDTELTPLHLTCIHGRYQAARLLLNRGATVNSREKNQLTPLHLACSHGHVELARLLLDRQADIEAKTISRWTPLHFACRHDRKEVISLLLDRDANLDSKTSCKDELTPLSMACQDKQRDIVWMLLQHDPLQLLSSGLRQTRQTKAIGSKSKASPRRFSSFSTEKQPSNHNDTSTPPASKRARPNPPS